MIKAPTSMIFSCILTISKKLLKTAFGMHLGSMRDFKIGSSLLWSCTAPARSRLLLPENSFCSATINAVAEKTRLDYTKLAVDSAKDATDTLKKELDVTSSAFQKAASDFPDGWDLIGQQIVAGLADTFNQVVSKAVPLLMASMSPMGKLDFLTGELGETATGLRSAIEGNGSTSNSDPKNNNMAPRPRQHPTTPGTPFMTDPAYSQVNKDITFFEMLQVLLTSGKEGGVNWEKAKGDVNNARSSAGFLKSMLNHSKESFSKLATTSETSSTYHGILNDMAKITIELNEEVVKGRTAGNTFPKAGDLVVSGWQDKFTKAFIDASSIYATAKSIPGNSPNGFPMVSLQAVEIGSVDAKSDHAKTMVDAAKFQLNATQQAYLATQANYQASTEMLAQQQNRMAEIQANLSKLKASTANLETTLKIFQESVSLIINMKSDISNLVLFFKGLSTLIEVVVTGDVRRFVKHLKGKFGGDGDDDGIDPNAKIGDFTIADAQCEFLYRTAVIIRGYFSLFADVADMWVELSVENITPGINLIEELGRYANNPEQLDSKVAELTAWTDKACGAIEAKAGEAYNQMIDQMDVRFKKIAAVTQQLPPPTTVRAIMSGSVNDATLAKNANDVKEAMERGVEKVKEAAKLSLERKKDLLD